MTREVPWQLRFEAGRQQRYLPDRRSVLHYILAIGPQTADPVFEVWAAGERVRLADGSDGGAAYRLVEVLDLSEPGIRERVRAELDRLGRTAPQRLTPRGRSHA